MEEVEGEVSAMKRRKGNGTCQCSGCEVCTPLPGEEVKCGAEVGVHLATVLCVSCKKQANSERQLQRRKEQGTKIAAAVQNAFKAGQHTSGGFYVGIMGNALPFETLPVDRLVNTLLNMDVARDDTAMMQVGLLRITGVVELYLPNFEKVLISPRDASNAAGVKGNPKHIPLKLELQQALEETHTSCFTAVNFAAISRELSLSWDGLLCKLRDRYVGILDAHFGKDNYFLSESSILAARVQDSCGEAPRAVHFAAGSPVSLGDQTYSRSAQLFPCDLELIYATWATGAAKRRYWLDKAKLSVLEWAHEFRCFKLVSGTAKASTGQNNSPLARYPTPTQSPPTPPPSHLTPPHPTPPHPTPSHPSTRWLRTTTYKDVPKALGGDGRTEGAMKTWHKTIVSEMEAAELNAAVRIPKLDTKMKLTIAQEERCASGSSACLMGQMLHIDMEFPEVEIAIPPHLAMSPSHPTFPPHPTPPHPIPSHSRCSSA